MALPWGGGSGLFLFVYWGKGVKNRLQTRKGGKNQARNCVRSEALRLRGDYERSSLSYVG